VFIIAICLYLLILKKPSRLIFRAPVCDWGVWCLIGSYSMADPRPDSDFKYVHSFSSGGFCNQCALSADQIRARGPGQTLCDIQPPATAADPQGMT
jgi:hypothetical protein